MQFKVHLKFKNKFNKKGNYIQKNKFNKKSFKIKNKINKNAI